MVSIGCGLAFGVAACGSSSPSGAGGSGGGAAGAAGTAGGAPGKAGASGSAGAAGAPGSAGASGAVSCGDLPACVASLVAACPLPPDSCFVAASVSGDTTTHKLCFGNGVKVVDATTNDLNTGESSFSISVTKNGVVCYTLDGTSNANDPVTTPVLLSFKNAAGTEVAIFSSDVSTYPNPTTVTCTGGQPVAITSFGNCGMPNSPESQQCQGSTCTAP
jgi:hypothetical protein